MNIEGTYTLQAAPEQVWQCLMDQAALLEAIPGVERVEHIDQDSYAITMNTQQRSLLRGAYQGKLAITEKQYPYHYRIAITGQQIEETQSTFSGTGSIHLNKHDGTTVIAYKGVINFERPSAQPPANLVKGATRLLLQQFFIALTEQMHSNENIPASETEKNAGELRSRPGANFVPAEPSIEERSNNLWSKIARALGLRTDSLPAGQLGKRLRRIGIILGLFFLVWVGTRLPRRDR